MRDSVVQDIFDALTRYLSRVGFVGVRRISLKHSSTAQRRNWKSARSFCHVIIGRPVIYCAMPEMEVLPDEFICGLLLHEIAHILIKEDGGDPELQVDEWVLASVPEAGYKYQDVTYYDLNQWRTAKNVERVSAKFLKKLKG